MEQKGVMTNKGILIKRECDEPMARSKRYLPCKQDCGNCICCIETFEGGKREHVTKYREYDREPIVKKFI